MPSFKATDAVASKPSWLSTAQQTDCHGADPTETAGGLVMHQGWTVPAGGNGNVLAQRETIACVNMISDIGAGDDTIFGLVAAEPAWQFTALQWTDRPQSAADYPIGGLGTTSADGQNSGSNDVQISGTWTGTVASTVRIEIQTVDPMGMVADEFKWSIDTGTPMWTNNVPMVNGPMPLADGISVLFQMGTVGHVLSDSWTAPLSEPDIFTTQTYPLTPSTGVVNPDDQRGFPIMGIRIASTHTQENPLLLSNQLKLVGGDWYHGVQGGNDIMVPQYTASPLPRPVGWMVSDNNVFKQMDPTESYKCATRANPFPFTATVFLESLFESDGVTAIQYPYPPFDPIEYPAGASIVVPFLLENWQDAGWDGIDAEPAAITFTIDTANIDTTQTYHDSNWGGNIALAFIFSFMPHPLGGLGYGGPYVWQLDTPPAIPEYISYGYRERTSYLDLGTPAGYLNYFESNHSSSISNASYINLATQTVGPVSTLTITGGSSCDHMMQFNYGLWDDYAIILGHTTSVDGRNPSPVQPPANDLPQYTRITLEILPPDNGYSTWPTVPTTLDCCYDNSTLPYGTQQQVVTLILDDSGSLNLNIPAGQLAIAEAWAFDLNTTQSSAMSAENVRFKLKGTAWTP